MPPALAAPCDNHAVPRPLEQLPEDPHETPKATPVPDLAPFRGLRYTSGPDLSAVTAPPYDVIDPEERTALLARDPNNAVRLILPGDGTGDPYTGAAETLASWRRADVLRADPEPLLYAYRMVAPRSDGASHETIGVIGALALPDDPANGDVLPHERTLPKAKSDRLALLEATRANFDPIWGLTLATGLTELAATATTVASAVDEDGVRHEIGLLDDPRCIEAIRSLVQAQPVVLADGHHRFETACTYRAKSGGPGCDAILCLIVELDDAQLDVRPFHRLVHGAPPDLRARLGVSFEIGDTRPNVPEQVDAVVEEMARSHALGLVDARGVALLTPRADALRAALQELPEALHDVDAARFDVAILPLLADADLAYRNDARVVAAAVAAGSADAAILLRGAPVESIRAAAAAGVRMPEKTTYFAPKPRTGMVMRSLDD
jgi:uncharacterized protein (DUF1015 family)